MSPTAIDLRGYVLIATARHSGTVKRSTDPEYIRNDICFAARRLGLTVDEAIRQLKDGQEIVTAGFIRKLVAAEDQS